VGRELRKAHWDLQKNAGIELLPVGDFAWYDQVLTHSLMFGVIPERFRPHDGKATLQTLFGMARGVSDSCCGGAHAQEMTKWFDTNYHYLVPEFSADQQFQLGWEQLFEEVEEARALGHNVKPVIIGPLTYLWLGKAKGADFDKLDLLNACCRCTGRSSRASPHSVWNGCRSTSRSWCSTCRKPGRTLSSAPTTRSSAIR
jgi:5-methyltetrahydropteroyltriglutamate--homocysteine methyltransferase